MKLRLSIASGSLAGQEFEIGLGSALLLGRGPDCTVTFDGTDQDVSRRHAVIESDRDGFLLVDQGSSNGTFVNGRRVERVRLAANDVIRLGRRGPEIRTAIEGVSSGVAATMAEPDGRDWRATVRTFGFYDPSRERARPASRHDYGLIVCLAMIAVGSIAAVAALLLVGFTDVGLAGALVGILIAFAPAPFYLLLWLWFDRYDPEPAWALGAALAWGAGVAILGSYVVNTTFGVLITLTAGQGLSTVAGSVLIAPVVEEAAKGIGLLILFLFLRRHFDGVVDGIVYAGVIALGFATVENVLYYGRQVDQQGAGLIVLFVLRGLLSPFSHALYTSMIGIGFGIARESHNTAVRLAAPVGGYVAAVLLHALWNAGASLPLGLVGFMILYVLIWVPLFLAFLGGVFWLMRREAQIVRTILKPEVQAGLITREQLERTSSILRRLQWLGSALLDFEQLMVRRRFLRAVTRLGFCHWHAQRARAARSDTVSLPQIPALRAEIKALQARLPKQRPQVEAV